MSLWEEGADQLSLMWIGKEICLGYIGISCMHPQEEKKGLLHLQPNRSSKQGIMTKIFHGHSADCKPVAHSVQDCSCVIIHLCAYKAECCLIQPLFPSCGF
jgi:hypothetical protein